VDQSAADADLAQLSLAGLKVGLGAQLGRPTRFGRALQTSSTTTGVPGLNSVVVGQKSPPWGWSFL
jgi:hypothetical protein